MRYIWRENEVHMAGEFGTYGGRIRAHMAGEFGTYGGRIRYIWQENEGTYDT